MSKDFRFIRPRQTFEEVLGQCGDQVLVRQLLIDLLPQDVKWRIVFHFNKGISERNLRALDASVDTCPRPSLALSPEEAWQSYREHRIQCGDDPAVVDKLEEAYVAMREDFKRMGLQDG